MLAADVKKKYAPPTRGNLRICDAKQKFDSKDVILLVGNINYTYIYLQSGKVIVSSKTLKRFEEMLQTIGFLRINKNSIINPAFMDNRSPSSPNEVIMQNGKVVRVSRRRKGLMGE